jgi:glutaconate CoA-transferase subunit A
MDSDIILPDVEALAARVPDGAKIAVVKNDNGVPMEQVRALIRRGIRDLHVVCVPTGGMAVDLLVGAGCVKTLETAGVTLDEFGQAPAFGRAVRDGRIRLKDATCPAIYAALQAGEKRIPFIPLRGLIGSDVQKNRDDWKIIDNPFAVDDPVVLLEAIVPDIALIHAPMADRYGNVYVGERRELMTMAHAALSTIVTTEEIVEDNLLDDPLRRPATISSVYIDAIASARKGSLPLNMPEMHGIDTEHMALYAKMARDEAGFARYLDEFVFGRKEAAE